MFRFNRVTYVILIVICSIGFIASTILLDWDNLSSIKTAYKEMVLPSVFIGCSYLFYARIRSK
jgi:hypothetical protein